MYCCQKCGETYPITSEGKDVFDIYCPTCNLVTTFSNQTTDTAHKIKLGDCVRKVGGELAGVTGVVIGEGMTRRGKKLWLVEFDLIPGLVHVYGTDVLEVIKDL